MMLTANQIAIDTNVLLEILLERDHQQMAEEFLLKQHASNLNISALTAHLVMHFGSNFHKQDVLRQFLSDYRMLALKSVDFDWAFNNAQGKDFEDALQLDVAIRNGCKKFVTFDKNYT